MCHLLRPLGGGLNEAPERGKTARRARRGGSRAARRAFDERLERAHVRIALGNVDDQLALIGRVPDRHAPRRQRRGEREAEALRDLRGREAERRIVLVDDEAHVLRVHARVAQRLEQLDGRHDGGDALVAQEPRFVGGVRGLRDEIAVREAAQIDDLAIEERAQPVHQAHARRVRHIAQPGQVRRQRRERDAARMARERRVHEGPVEAAQVAHRLDEIEFAARVQEQRAVARRQPEIDERRLAAERGRALLHQHRQVRGERARAHSGARAEQRDQPAVAARLIADVIEQPARDPERVLGGRGEIDEVAHARAQRGERAFRLAERAERDDRQPRMRHAQRGGRRARRLRVAAREIDEDEHRIEPRDPLRERRRLERRGLDRPRRHERLRKPAHVLAMGRRADEVVGDGGFSQGECSRVHRDAFRLRAASRRSRARGRGVARSFREPRPRIRRQHAAEIRPPHRPVALFGQLAGRRGQRRVLRDRRDEMRRHDDHEFLVVLLIAEMLEKRADDRQIAEERHLVDVRRRLAVDQPADREALAIAQLDGRVRAARRERGHRHAVDRDRMDEVELARFGRDLQRDPARAQHGRRQREADAVRLPVDRDRAERLRHRHRDLAAREEARALPGQRDERRLREHAREVVRLEDRQIGEQAARRRADDEVERGRDRNVRRHRHRRRAAARHRREAGGRERAEREAVVLLEEIQARLLEHRAAEFDDAHVDLHDVLAADRRYVEDAAVLARHPLADGERARMRVERRGRARHDRRAVVRLHARRAAVEQRARRAAHDVDRVGRRLVAAALPHHQARRAGRLRDEQHAAAAALDDEHVGDVRVCDGDPLHAVPDGNLPLRPRGELDRPRLGRPRGERQQHAERHRPCNQFIFHRVGDRREPALSLPSLFETACRSIGERLGSPSPDHFDAARRMRRGRHSRRSRARRLRGSPAARQFAQHEPRRRLIRRPGAGRRADRHRLRGDVFVARAAQREHEPPARLGERERVDLRGRHGEHRGARARARRARRAVALHRRIAERQHAHPRQQQPRLGLRDLGAGRTEAAFALQVHEHVDEIAGTQPVADRVRIVDLDRDGTLAGRDLVGEARHQLALEHRRLRADVARRDAARHEHRIREGAGDRRRRLLHLQRIGGNRLPGGQRARRDDDGHHRRRHGGRGARRDRRRLAPEQPCVNAEQDRDPDQQPRDDLGQMIGHGCYQCNSENDVGENRRRAAAA
ncbi:hypothetical protein BURPS1710b_1942 [Burkholderia pseudomallei 1710b]|uniref:Uncharacterized protein n=1 Tax=Burkholderia pseudomallei (strain 1710b) TaxID=320372 RepID=Q3JSW3_BURP1|nr:hypothetical protein BURPS1710b_1942 [Burkholderia pseudomallei 1710b]